MKKILLISSLFISVTSFSQSMLGKGGSQLNAGVGLSSWGLPVYIGFDYGVHKDVSLGMELSYRSYNERYNNYHYKNTIWGISGNANYHFNSIFKIPKNWDIYAGLNIGFYIWDTDDNYLGNHSSGLGIGGQVGIRYYFNDRFGLNLEGGGGNAFSGGKFGVTIVL